MSTTREINPFVKSALEYGPVLIFFVAYLRFKDETFTLWGTDYSGFIVVTAAFVPLLILATGALWALTGKISRMQVTTVILVTLFGGLSVWLNDERFFKMKPTAIYLLFAVLLAIGLARGQSYLKYVMEEMMPLNDAGWMILTKRLMLCFFGLALANELIWRFTSTETWVYFKTFGLTAAVFVFFMTQGRLFQTYGLEKDES
ncbi:MULTISPECIES: inner membrane-spanning protein YciB [Sulfitobacter]|jgi:intracellular septation protein|uniref:Inner membrane-spanning protein YciB n=2 Tax=root TaxID=1 RepID=A0A1H0M880_9RHOB|nr:MULTISPECIES: inner membrane-spanning protein YciB [Sulfitobacter]MBQ0717662.1 septation protein IspZ [Sulfitobacter litoralis]MBQ0767294.1 septation protein IspZ [Sulfitobacter litoralis]MBQ0802932.1 septation protein IspZ [Sulfitobacter litoralis]MCF7725422.1 septation protein A [Sulfitobacter sp. M22]MCF7776808.1 septation protein A [Sulfitobacter sp. M220]|tara:strand:+ start:3602 stop:4207 length:606 start_codon:yes stop_codon:yes gene_type:complete